MEKRLSITEQIFGEALDLPREERSGVSGRGVPGSAGGAARGGETARGERPAERVFVGFSLQN